MQGVLLFKSPSCDLLCSRLDLDPKLGLGSKDLGCGKCRLRCSCPSNKRDQDGISHVRRLCTRHATAPVHMHAKTVCGSCASAPLQADTCQVHHQLRAADAADASLSMPSAASTIATAQVLLGSGGGVSQHDLLRKRWPIAAVRQGRVNGPYIKAAVVSGNGHDLCRMDRVSHTATPAEGRSLTDLPPTIPCPNLIRTRILLLTTKSR